MAKKEIEKEFLENARDVGAFSAPSEAGEEPERLLRILKKIDGTPEGRELLDFLELYNIPVVFSHDTKSACSSSCIKIEGGAYLPIPGTQWILLNPEREDNILARALFHEARHARQSNAGLFMPGKQISPFDFVWYVRMKEADAEADNVLNLLRMKVVGDGALFDLGLEKKYRYAELYHVAEKTYAEDPASLDDGRLKRAVFDAWFAVDALKEGYDREAIDRQWESVRKIFDFYPDHKLPKMPLVAADIEKLGSLAGESVNYLKLPGHRPLEDVYYKESFTPTHLEQLKTLEREWEKKFIPLAKKSPTKNPEP